MDSCGITQTTGGAIPHRKEPKMRQVISPKRQEKKKLMERYGVTGKRLVALTKRARRETKKD
jgi:hypothetical protein